LWFESGGERLSGDPCEGSTLSIYDPERDREARLRFGVDTGAVARAHLANTKWQLGEVGPARALIEEAVAHATEIGHVPRVL
jgi:hypothetical protein